MVIFQYNLYIFVRIKHGCLTTTVYAMDPNNSVIKRLWCMWIVKSHISMRTRVYDVRAFSCDAHNMDLFRPKTLRKCID